MRFDSGPGQSSRGLTMDDAGDSWFVCLNGRQLKLKSGHWVLQISTDRDLGGYGMHNASVGSDSTISIIKIVSLSPRVEKLKVKKWINVSYLNNGESPVFRISLHLYICIVVLWLYNIYIYIYIYTGCVIPKT